MQFYMNAQSQMNSMLLKNGKKEKNLEVILFFYEKCM